jgi:hypothetical protein
MKWIVAGVTSFLSRLWAPIPSFAALAVKEPSTTNTELPTETPTRTALAVLQTMSVATRFRELKTGESYQLSPTQFKRLWTAANTAGMAFLVPSTKFEDEPQRARDLQALCADFDDLLALNLVVDVSGHYADNVKEAWEEQGRHIRFMVLSDLGQLMFVESDKRPVN